MECRCGAGVAIAAPIRINIEAWDNLWGTRNEKYLSIGTLGF